MNRTFARTVYRCPAEGLESLQEKATHKINKSCTYVCVVQLHVQYLCGTFFVTRSGLSNTVEY